MLIHSVVPVKALHQSKKRLATILTSQERKVLILAMLRNVLKALERSLVCKVCLVASDTAVQNLADEYEATYLQERQRGLNSAVEQGVKWCIRNGAEAVLILPADVPRITSEDINRIIDLGAESKCVVISPSWNGGTNALLQRPPGVIHPRFGPDSCMKHMNQAFRKGALVKFHWSRKVAFDVDTLVDLAAFLETVSRHGLTA